MQKGLKGVEKKERFMEAVKVLVNKWCKVEMLKGSKKIRF